MKNVLKITFWECMEKIVMSDKFRYEPLPQEQFEDLWQKHKKIIEGFVSNNGYDPKNISIDEKTVMSIIAKVDQRKRYFEYFHNIKMSEFKEVALIAFWYIKLRPISVCSTDESVRNSKIFAAINEKLALYYIFSTYRKMLKKFALPTDPLDKLPRAFINEILYSFEYRDISKEALILLVESMAVFLNLEPYQKVESK